MEKLTDSQQSEKLAHLAGVMALVAKDMGISRKVFAKLGQKAGRIYAEVNKPKDDLDSD